jgi:hypothetical protein
LANPKGFQIRTLPGDEVLSWNEAARQLEYKSVLRTYTRVTLQVLTVEVEGNAKSIITTPGHPFYARRAGDDGRLNLGEEFHIRFLCSKARGIKDAIHCSINPARPRTMFSQ